MLRKTSHHLILYILCGLLGVGNSIFAEFVNKPISSPTQYGTSARTLALGAIEGIQPDAYAIFENPAALPQDSKHYYSLFYTTLADKETGYFTSSVAYPFYGGELGFGFTQKRSPNLDFTAENNDGDFYSASKFAVLENFYKLGYSRPFGKNISLGSSVHYYTHDLYLTTGRGWNIDTGINFSNSPISVSLCLKNIIQSSKVKFSNNYAAMRFPSELVLSSKYTVSNSLAVYGQFSGKDALKSAGLQYSPLPSLDLLAGAREVEADGKHVQYSLGASLKLHQFNLHFSYQKTDVIENDNLYGFSIDVHM